MRSEGTGKMMKLCQSWMMFFFIVALLSLSGTVLAVDKPVRASQQELDRGASITAREKAVSEKEQDLARREKELQELGREIDAKLTDLTTLQTDLKEKIAELKAVQDKEFKKLIRVYSAMSATKLAPLLNQMDDEVVGKILRAMKPDFVAKVIPKLEREKAVRVSHILGML